MKEIYQQKPIQIWLICCCLAVLMMVVIGGYTRLTESGLSMVTWKPISGIVPPITASDWQNEFAAYQQTPEFKLRHYDMTISDFKSIFYVEYIHRIAGRMIGFIFLLPFLTFFIRKQLTSALQRKLLFIFLLGGFQGFIGWWMVKSGFNTDPFVSPLRLMIHLGLATIILGLLTHTLFRLSSKPPVIISLPTHHLLQTLLGILFLQILLGALVAGHKAGLIYNSFPTMHGEWLPDDSWHLTPWYRNIVEDPSTIQWLHRTCAYVIFVVSITFYYFASQKRNLRLTRWAIGIICLISFQMVLGILTLLWYVPLSLALAHQLGAMFIWMKLVALYTICEREK